MMRWRGLVIAPVLLAVGSPLAAQDFEKVGTPVPVSPTCIPYTVPASARAAGWTIAAPQSRLGLSGSNPAFLGTATGSATPASTTRWEVAIEGLYQYQDIESDVDRHEARFSAAAGKLALDRLAMGLAYQHPYHSEVLRQVFRDPELSEDFEILSGGAAFAVSPEVLVGAAVAWQRSGLGDAPRDAYHVTLGAEIDVAMATFAASMKSEPFGEDSDLILALSWLQLDARVPLGTSWALGARFATGWWNNTTGGRLNSPLDIGAGVSTQIIPTLQLLAGVHHVSERVEGENVMVGSSIEQFVDRDQGTFLDAGLVLGISMFHVALSVEDSHVFDASAPSTWVTMSVNAAF